MILTEYDEIMEKISLSPEARDRIINNIADEMSSSEGYVPVRAKKRTSAWKKYITLAACCVLVVTGVMAAARNDLFINLTGEKDMGADTAVTAEETELSGELNAAGNDSLAPSEEVPEVASDEELISEGQKGSVTSPMSFGSEEALSEFLGFGMSSSGFSEICEKEGLTEVSYNALDGDIGEIVFTDGDRVNRFRKARGTEDISGDCNVYDTEAEFDGEYSSGTLKGKADSYELAVWTTADGFTYSAYAEGGLSAKEWFAITDGQAKEE